MKVLAVTAFAMSYCALLFSMGLPETLSSEQKAVFSLVFVGSVAGTTLLLDVVGGIVNAVSKGGDRHVRVE